MSHSSNTPSTQVEHRGFDDGHLTLKQKYDFWNFRIDGWIGGQHYKGSVWGIGVYPQLAKQITGQYITYAKNRKPTEDRVLSSPHEEQLLAKTAARVPIQNGPPSKMAERLTSSQNALNTTINLQQSHTDIVCVCGASLSSDDGTYCEDCWCYFTLSSKRAEFKEDLVADSKRLAQPLSTDVDLIQKSLSGPSTAFHGHPVLNSASISNIQTYPKEHPQATVNPTILPPQHGAISNDQTWQGFGPLARQPGSYLPAQTAPRQITQSGPPSEVIDLTTPPQGSPIPKKPTVALLPHATCKKCSRDFPVNPKKNDGIHCTQCTNRAKKM